MTYSAALAELEGIMTALREQEIDIDDLEKKVKRAAVLIKWCRERLRTVEGQLENIDGPDLTGELF